MNNNPGDRPLSLAGHFRNVATLLRSGALTYDWRHHHSCNCGLLARAITGSSAFDLMSRMRHSKNVSAGEDGKTNWSKMAEGVCSIAGVTHDELFEELFKAGLKFEDISSLEFLSNPVIRDHMEKNFTFTKQYKKYALFGPTMTKTVAGKAVHDERNSLIGYLESWAALIEQFHAAKPAVQTFDEKMDAVETRPLVPIT